MDYVGNSYFQAAYVSEKMNFIYFKYRMLNYILNLDVK